jgi:hypothetical protein
MALYIGERKDEFTINYATTRSCYGTSQLVKFYDRTEAEEFVRQHQEFKYEIFEI